MTIRTPIGTRSNRVPPWAAWLTVFVLLVGGVYFASNLSGTNPRLLGALPSSPPGSGAIDVAAAPGLIDKAGCKACHGPNLSGQATFPNLHGLQGGPSVPNLQQLGKDHPSNWMELWIAGTDPAVASIDRKGMPKFGGTLTPAEIATIAAYLQTLK